MSRSKSALTDFSAFGAELSPFLTDGLVRSAWPAFLGNGHKINETTEKNGRKIPPRKKETHEYSDEDLKTELENAVKNYKKNIKNEPQSMPPLVRTGKTPVLEKNSRGRRKWNKETKLNENTHNKKEDSCADVLELINYFFAPQQDRNVKSYSDYEKQGAIPKGEMRRKTLDKVAGFRDGKFLEMLNVDSSDEIVRVSEDICVQPFYYVVPANPCPNFFFPRGCYYVVPEVPSSSMEGKIVFHPERGTSYKTENKKKQKKQNSNFVEDSMRLNNLGKDAVHNMDSHLNIGPLDVKMADSSNNLERNFCWNKIFEKTIDNESGTTASSEERKWKLEAEEANGNGGDTVLAEVTFKVQDVMLRLMKEFPEMSLARTESLAKEYLDNEVGLENFIASEQLRNKIRDQFEILVLALPEIDPAELQEKCDEFNGDEALVNAYIENMQRENRIQKRVVDLQHIFPDAEPDFLLESVEELNGDDAAISLLTVQLLESQDYPKITQEPVVSERRMLWEKYVDNFSAKNFIRNTPNQKIFTESFENRAKTQADWDVVYKYLETKYLSMTAADLKECFADCRYNLSETCEYLSETQYDLGAWKDSIKNEKFSEVSLREIAFAEHRKEIEALVKEMKELREIEIEEARVNNCFLACPLCASEELIASEVITCPEGHVFCTDCIRMFVSVKMGDGVFKFSCPLEKCETFFSLRSLENLLPDTVLLKINQKQQTEEINTAGVEGLESCPHCDFAYIPNPEDKIFKCQNSVCLIETCRNCREENHIPLRCEEIEREVDIEARKRIEETMTEKLVRVCPKCKKKIVKIDGCNKIACSCGCLFCYICGNFVTGYEHFHQNQCPLYSNNEVLHHTNVIQAGIRARDEILRENPNIRILYDPTYE